MEGFDDSRKINVELTQNQIKLLIKTLLDVIEVHPNHKTQDLQHLAGHLMSYARWELNTDGCNMTYGVEGKANCE